MPGGAIKIRGARTHNLRNLDLDLPRDALIVLTGPSGSGKSSLAFDTIFAEGQRRYVESLSASARQFLAQLPKPDVDLIEGLSPTVALQQENRGRNPRSTVGTATEVYDFLRLLFARIGEVYSWVSGKPLRRQTVQEMIDAVLALPERSKFAVVAPVVKNAAGDHAALLADLRAQGFVRVAIDDALRDLDEDIALAPDQRHTIEVFVDRLVLKPGIEGRLADSIEIALGLAKGRVTILPLEGEPLEFADRFTDFEHGLAYPELTPGLFSFNSPEGACPDCDGLGRRRVFDMRRLIPDGKLSLKEGAIAPLGKRPPALERQLAALAEHLGFDLYAPWESLDERVQLAVLYGTGDEAVPELAEAEPSKPSKPGKKSGKPTSKAKATQPGQPFPGIVPLLEDKLRELEQRGASDEGEAGEVELELDACMSEVVCASCQGERLRIEARHVKIAGQSIHQLARLPVEQLIERLAALAGPALDAERGEVAKAILDQAIARLRAMIELGLGYLDLDRATMSLSGGEAQRIRLATQIGSSLVGVTYVLDEPSVGLHQRDNAKLIALLQRLRDVGNTVIVVEHDADTIRAADHVVDIGPGAGVQGGELVFAGSVPALLDERRSTTAAYLSGRRRIERPTRRKPAERHIAIRGARGHNLRNVDVDIPIAALTCVTGVSGSGKSSLIVDTLLPEAQRRLNRAWSSAWPLEHDAIVGLEQCERVIAVDQSPIGRSPRSNAATYTGIFADLRNLYAQTPEAKLRGFSPSRFSFNVKGGRCEHCQGEGLRRIEMHFLPDVWVTCRVCEGRRYNRETLAIAYRGKHIADALALTIDDACEFFVHHAGLRHKLEVLRDVGLGYLSLGQSATTLSGGEAQRIKLAKELARKRSAGGLFVLDEPTTGLHFDDVRKLLEVLERLVDEGNTVIVIEHDLEVIKCADWVIDVGPEGGDAGGRIVAVGRPEQIVAAPNSVTGQWLARVL